MSSTKKRKVIKDLSKGNYILIDDVPCEIVKINVSKSGKHGGAKCRLQGIGLFDGRRRSIVKPADTKVDVPVVLKKRAQVLAVSDETVQLMDLSDYSMLELDVPEELKGGLESGKEVNYFEVADKRTLKRLK